MHGSCVEMKLVLDAERLFGGNMSEQMERMVPLRLLLQEAELLLVRRLTVQPEVALMAQRIRIQLPDILIAARGMSHIEGRAVHPDITVKRLRTLHQHGELTEQLLILL